MPNEFSYVIDLTGIELNDEGVTWLQAMPLGTYNHPRYGKMTFTPERVMRFAQNVKAGVRDIDLDIDYDHKQQRTDAAGWVRDAEARLGDADESKNGLWIAVEWTKEALGKIKDKAYRYFSPEFDDKWTHPKTGQSFKDVLFGGALTNRPFLKDILPINLSEIPGGFMLDEMRKLLGLPEDADEVAVLAAAQDKLKSPQGSSTEPEGEPGDGGEGSGEGTPVPPATPPTNAPAPEGELVTANEAKAMTERIAQLETALHLQQVDARIVQLNDSNAKFAVTPVLADRIKELALEAPYSLTEKVFALAEEMVKGDGLVELGEKGHVSDSGGDTATKRLSDKTDVLVKGGMSYSDALEQIASEDPALWQAHRQEAYIRERG